jgi:AraC-like DNA-binding protein
VTPWIGWTPEFSQRSNATQIASNTAFVTMKKTTLCQGEWLMMDWKTRVVINYIVDNLNRKHNLKELAELVNLSPSRLCYKFKAETGTSLARYQKSLKLEKAKELLETTCLRVKEIMVRVGIEDESHFVRDFKKIFNVTPTQHRMLYRNITSDAEIISVKSANE